MVWNKENWSTCVRAHGEKWERSQRSQRGQMVSFFFIRFPSWRPGSLFISTKEVLGSNNISRATTRQLCLYSRRHTSLTVRKLKVHPVGCASGKVTGVSPIKWIIHFRADFMSVCLLYHEILYVESRLFGKGSWSGENDCALGISKMHCDGPHFWLKLQNLFTSSNMDEMSVLCFW